MRQWETDVVRTNVAIDVKPNDITWIYQLDKSLEDHDAWINRLTKRVEETTWEGDKYTIYRVPQWLRIIDSSAYEPRILSLGPYHYGKPQFRATNELKWIYLKNFLRRNPHIGLGDYINIVGAMEAKTREVYKEVPHMDSKHWVEMMLLDSCFVVEMLLTKFLPEEINDEALDPTSSNFRVLLPHVVSDMLLLENQLPFFLLEKLLCLNCFNIINPHTLAEIVLEVFVNVMPGKVQLSSHDSITNIHHILHLLYSCTLPACPAWGVNTKKRKRRSSFKPLPRKLMLSAKNLKEAGVVFRNKTKNVTSFMDITFRKGILEIPPLQIFEESKLVFRNLIAFEQCGNQCSTHWGAYTYMMDCIIDTPADFALLQQNGIIVSTLDNDDETARFFNRLRTNATIDKNNYLSDVIEQVHRHCNKRVNKWKTSLNHNYLTNPWVIVSVIAAILLFLFTITQTILALFSYLWQR